MDWSSTFGVIFAALLTIIGLIVALRRRKKGGPQKREELYQHLNEMGIQASLIEKNSDKEKIGLSRASGQRSEGIIGLEDKNIDSINIISAASQYETRYFADYLVTNPNITETRKPIKTRMKIKKSSPFRGKVIALEWTGDKSLARSLNFDYGLEDKLLHSEIKGSIEIIPEPKHGYVRIRTAYSLPSSQEFEAINIIARHVKSW